MWRGADNLPRIPGQVGKIRVNGAKVIVVEVGEIGAERHSV